MEQEQALNESHWKPTYTQEVVDGKVFSVCTVPSGDFGTCTTRGVDLEATMQLQFKMGMQKVVDWVRSHRELVTNYGETDGLFIVEKAWQSFLAERGLK